MAYAKNSDDQSISLPALDIQFADITLVGDTPLICHAWSQKAKREMLGKQMKEAKGGRSAKDPVQDFKDSLYTLKAGGYGFPSVAIKACAVRAITSIQGAGLTMVAARQAFHITGELIDMTGAFGDGSLTMRQDLVRVQGSEPSMREDMVRVGMGTADLRYRGEFWPWHVKVLTRFNRRVFSLEQILNLLNTAGFAVGIGEWRPEKAGSSGMFHVAAEGEV